MALLAQELVEEWLNRDGWFTIRGIKIGVDQIHILAIKPTSAGAQCRHVEVQASFDPVGYLTKIPKAKVELGQARGSAKQRNADELREAVHEWVKRRFDLPRKAELREKLCDGKWTRELVVNNLRHAEEKEIIRSEGIIIHELSEVVASLKRGGHVVPRAAGGDFVDLITGFDSPSP